MPRSSLSISAAIEKLKFTAELVQCRESITAGGERRIKDALAALVEPAPTEKSKTANRRAKYCHFLSKVNRLSGSRIVLLCAIGIGQYAVTNMKNANCLRLPMEIKKQELALQQPFFKKLVETFSVKVPLDTPSSAFSTAQSQPQAPQTEIEGGQLSQQAEISLAAQDHGVERQGQKVGNASECLAGQVYELTLEDIHDITRSQQIRGAVWLTYPYNSASLPFITITIPHEVGIQFARQRPQTM